MIGMDKINIKLIALDIDGTLLNRDGEITLENRKAIKEAQDKGLYIVLSTGRSILTCREHVESLSLSSYLVTVNGSEIWEGTEKNIERNTVQPKFIKWMWDLSKEHKTSFWATSNGKVWRDEMPEDIDAHEWLKFGFNIEEDVIRDKIFKMLQEKKQFEISNSSPTNIEVNPNGINKAKGLKKVCNLLNITMDHVMAVGDSLNDIAMIKEAGLGVAMGNAQEAVKEAADWVTSTNLEDGVAVAIRKWVL